MQCPEGQILRKSYTRKGKRVAASCIKRVSHYAEKYSNFQQRVKSRMTQRLRGISKTYRGNTKKCCPGKILRKSYVRYSKSGKRTLVKADCIIKRGNPEPIKNKAIGPLRHGDLTAFGYSKVKTLSKNERQEALDKAITKYGSLSVWRKLNALYVLNKNTNPELSAIFNNDKAWIKTTYGLSQNG